MSGAAQVIRLEADQIEARHGRGQFRRRRKLDNSPRGEQLVIAAVARAKEGDADALRYLYLRYADNVYGYVCSIVRDEWEAEDVTQHIFAKLLTQLARYEPRVVPFSAWILRVAHNAAVDHVRARRPVPIEHVHSPDEVAPGGGREALADLRLALDALPAEQRDVARSRPSNRLTGQCPLMDSCDQGKSATATRLPCHCSQPPGTPPARQ